jgi:hypothetical protein
MNQLRHFRNSVAHNRFEVKSESKKISSVIFRDYDSNNENAKQTFQLEITATKIYNFALKISDCFLNAMANEEGSSSFKFHKEQEENFTYQEIRRMDIH